MKRCPTRMEWSAYLAFLGIIVLILAGCGAGRTLVMKRADTKLKVSSVEASEGKSPVDVPDDIKLIFKGKLNEFLYQEGAFQRGGDLKIKYRFIQFDPGSQFARYMLGGIGNTGEGSLTIEATYFDAAEIELATIQAEGRIGSGFFGGGFSLAVERAAEKIAEYTVANFK